FLYIIFFFSSRRRHTRSKRDCSSDVCSSDLIMDFVSKIIVSLWNDSVISAIVSCSSWIAMGVFAVGCILMLYDILEARSEEKAEIGRASCRERMKIGGVWVVWR